MPETRTVSEFGNDYKCTSFFDVDTQTSGVDVSRDDERLGSIVGLDIPDPTDAEECHKFRDEVIEWLVENES